MMRNLSVWFKTFVLLTVFVFSFHAFAFAQNESIQSQIDSAKQFVESVEKEKGPDHPDAFSARDQLAGTLAKSGKGEEALKIALENFALLKTSIDPKQGYQLPMEINSLIVALLGQSDQAIAARKELVQWGESKAGPDHTSTLVFQTALAKTLADLGQKKQAIELNESLIGKLESRLKPDDVIVVMAQNSLFNWHRESGHHEKGLEFGSKCLESILGAKDGMDSLAFDLAAKIGQSYTALKEPAKALPLMQKTLDVSIANVGENNMRVAGLKASIAKVHHDAGDFPAAIKLMEQVVKVLDSNLGQNHNTTIANRSLLGMYYKRNGQWKEAISSTEILLQQFTQTYSSTHPSVLGLQEAVATLYEKAGDAEKSEQLMKSVQTQRQQSSAILATALQRFEEEKKSSQPGSLLRSTPDLISAYSQVGKNEDAIQLGIGFQKQSVEKLGLSDIESLKANTYLVNALLSAGENQEAINQRKQYVQLVNKQLGPNNPTSAVALLAFAESLWRVGEQRDSIGLAKAGMKQLQKSAGAGDIYEASYIKGGIALANRYLGVGMIEQAIALYELHIPQMLKFTKDDQPDVINARASMGLCLIKLNRGSEAVTVLEAAKSGLEKSSSTNTNLYSEVQQLLAQAKNETK